MIQQPAKSFHVRRAGIVLLIFLCLLGTAGWARQHLESPDHVMPASKTAKTEGMFPTAKSS